ncbi:MAG: hypothetical protein AB1428_09250 [Bacteroidota bacterium]
MNRIHSLLNLNLLLPLILILILFSFPSCLDRDLLTDVITGGPSDVHLRPGQSVRILPEDFLVTFDRVTSDSRCPTGALCIWAGDAGTRFMISRMRATAIDCTLHTTLDPRSIRLDGVTLTLHRLLPYPVLDVPIDPASYVATLRISHGR